MKRTPPYSKKSPNVSPRKKVFSFGLSLVIASTIASQATEIKSGDGTGNIVVNANQGGADSYVLNGSAGPIGPWTAVFNNITALTGGTKDVVTVDDDDHSIINNGELNGGADDDGIRVKEDITNSGGIINNDGGKIIGKRGINDNGDNEKIYVTNRGEITGLDGYGIRAGDDSTITNGHVNGIDTGSIEGRSGDAGIQGRDDLTVTNNLNSTILGDDDGIEAKKDVSITNHGSITGTNGHGIKITEDATSPGSSTVDNVGSSITGGGGSGIQAKDNLTVTNGTTSTITGEDDDGIDAGDNLHVTNDGEITGKKDHGIEADNNLTVINNSNGEIKGEDGDGIEADDDASVTNHNKITGSDDGVTAGSGVITNKDGGIIEGEGTTSASGDGIDSSRPGAITVNNESGGLIIGARHGIYNDSDSDNDTVNNGGGASSATITGTTGKAMVMGGGDDTVNLKNKSIVNGDVDGGDDTDTINFTGDNTTNGDVQNFEFANKDEGGFSLVEGNLDSDEVNVKDGQLTLIDGLDATDTKVGGFGSSAELGGLGIFDSGMTNINSMGIFSPGRRPLSVDSSMAVGALRHNGELNFNGGSAYRVDFNPVTSAHDVITQDGALSMSGGSTALVGPTSVNTPLQDGTYEIINQLGGSGDTTGIFGSDRFLLDGTVVGSEEASSPYNVTNTGTFKSSTVRLNTYEDGSGDVKLEVEHDYTKPDGLTPNGKAFGAYLNTLVDDAPGNDELGDFLAFLDYSDEDLVAHVMNEFDPSFHVAVSDIAFHSGHSLNRMVENHLFLVRNQDTGTTTTIPGGPKSGPIVVETPSHAWNFWGTASGEDIDVTREHFVTNNGRELDSVDLDGEALSFTAGADYRVSHDFVVGIFGQVSNTDLDGDTVDIEADSYFVGLYGTWGGSEGLFVDGLIGFGSHEFDTERSLFAGLAEASYDADGLVAMLGAGYMMGEVGSWQWGPVASVEYQDLDVDGFKESGSSLTVGQRDVESLRSLVGFKASGVAGGLNWNGAVRWAHDFTADDDRDISAGFIGLPGSFTSSGGERGEDSLILNAGINKDISDRVNVGLSYFGEISLDDDGFESHGGALELNISF